MAFQPFCFLDLKSQEIEFFLQKDQYYGQHDTDAGGVQ